MRFVYALLLLLLAVSYFVFHGEQEEKKNLLIKTHSYIEGLRIIQKKNGSDAWVVTARRADFIKGETVAQMDAVTIKAIPEGVVANADSGTYTFATKELHLDNNIKIRIKDSVISAKSLAWNPSTGLLTSTDKVRMDGTKFRVEGEGLTVSQDQKLKLMNNVTATFF
ncbi:MAG: LPS export ABC transporter periplasmic protein LptC [Thermodesulfovibrionales bacterium]